MLIEKRPPRPPASSHRDPQRTRGRLLEAAFHEVYLHGFQGADVDAVVERAQVTKGALYHHFDGKEDLGHALIDEFIMQITRDKWLLPLQSARNPVDALIKIVQGTSMAASEVGGGCPLNNLAQEMSPLSEGFRQRLAFVFNAWQNAIAIALQEGQKLGQVRRDVNAAETATYIVAVYEGYISLAKNAQEGKILNSGVQRITQYLESLRPAGRAIGGKKRRTGMRKRSG
jgi:TetR/AcrR family transcriptional regulator, transcriptional repressor for nem operon